NPGRNEDEELKLLTITGNVVTFSWVTSLNVTRTDLAYSHIAPAGMAVYLSDVSRNVAIESAPVATDAMGRPVLRTYDRGHVMFMHNPNVDVEYAGFYGLGRTDKRNPLSNPLFDANDVLIPGSGLNPVG